MTDNFLDQVPRKSHVLWARLLSVIGSLLSGAVLLSLLAPLASQSSKPIHPIAVVIWGLFFVGCTWVFAKSLFFFPASPFPASHQDILYLVINLLPRHGGTSPLCISEQSWRLTIRSSRDRFAAAELFGKLSQRRGRKALRLNSGVSWVQSSLQ